MSGGIRSLAAVAVFAACGGAKAEPADPQACAPVEDPAPGVAATGLAGEYTLRLIATSGTKNGGSTGGRLALMEQDSAHRSLERSDGSVDTTFTFPLYGTAEVEFEAVGAIVPGDAGTPDPLSPGVLVIERRGGVLLRVGSEANRRGMRRFDGGYTVLEVQQVTDGGFAGTWRSGVGLEQSGGYFCAARAT
jgi:hypothetical protein